MRKAGIVTVILIMVFLGTRAARLVETATTSPRPGGFIGCLTMSDDTIERR